MSKLKVSQTFSSFQGEGRYTGQLAVWLRLFGCNLKCPGFSQPNPADPSTYIKPVSFDPKSIKTLDDFPVIEYGCDTLYAIDPRFKHLRRDMEPSEVLKELQGYLPDGVNWHHKNTYNDIHLGISGGEPLLQQKALAEFFSLMDWNDTSSPALVQFETNGTQEVTSEFSKAVQEVPIHFNVSLKLHNVSGENYDWSAEVLESMLPAGSLDLKIVVNSSDAAWKELETKYSKLCADLGDAYPPVFIMPVGSTYDQQTNYKEIEKITKRAINSGFHISGRLHCVTLGNAVDV